jgi:AcrR family transcriptional regulator
MNPPARICRAIVQDIIGRPALTGRQRDREDKILIAGEKLMARFGRHGITFALVAASVSITRATLFFHYTDLDALLGEILRRHLRALATALGEVPHDAPNRQAVLRATYLHATRGPFGGLCDAHLLLTRDRHLLPEDELEGIELTWQSLGENMAGDLGAEALDLLERPWMTAARVEPLLATLEDTKNAPAPELELPPPKPPAHRYGPTMPAHIAAALESGDLTWLRPAGLGSLADPIQEAPPPLRRVTTQ